jgi:hypothetical protein
MIRRSVVAVAAAGVLVLATGLPGAATVAYPAPEDSLTCAAAQVPAGEVLECTIGGPDGASAQLQTTFAGEDAAIAGTVTSAAKTIAGNIASFTVTAPSTEGIIGVTGIIDGQAVDTASVEVVVTADIVEGAGPLPGDGGTSTDGGVETGDGVLSGTGFENSGLAIGAGALLVAGGVAVFVGARRRNNQA